MKEGESKLNKSASYDYIQISIINKKITGLIFNKNRVNFSIEYSSTTNSNNIRFSLCPINFVYIFLKYYFNYLMYI